MQMLAVVTGSGYNLSTDFYTSGLLDHCTISFNDGWRSLVETFIGVHLNKCNVLSWIWATIFKFSKLLNVWCRSDGWIRFKNVVTAYVWKQNEFTSITMFDVSLYYLSIINNNQGKQDVRSL